MQPLAHLPDMVSGTMVHLPPLPPSTIPRIDHSITYTDKKENQIYLKYTEIQNCVVAKSYMGNYLRISSYIRNPFLMYDFGTAPL
jgi:hypothetical protein